jgi:hypothetical protein
MNEIISGIIGGAIVLILQKIWDKTEQHKKDRNVSSTINKKILPRDILESLTPGLSLEKAKEFLGIPDNIYKLDETYLKEYIEIEENYKTIHVYTFKYKNAILKVGSLDNIVIDSISIFQNPKSNEMIRIFVNKYDSSNCGILGVMKVNDEMIEITDKILNFSIIRERLFGLRSYYGRYGNYMYFTYFFSSFIDFDELDEKVKPTFFKNETIIGFCVSNNSISLEVSYEEFD